MNILIIISLIILFTLLILYLEFYKGDKINKILIFLVVLTITGAVTFLFCFPSEKWNSE